MSLQWTTPPFEDDPFAACDIAVDDAVDDAGTILQPQLAEGQVHGGHSIAVVGTPALQSAVIDAQRDLQPVSGPTHRTTSSR